MERKDMESVKNSGSLVLDADDARAFVAEWVAEHGHVRKGILQSVTSGLNKSLAIMTGAPARYSESQRADMREAIDYLTRADWSDPAVCKSSF
jgi:hypothetical protein